MADQANNNKNNNNRKPDFYSLHEEVGKIKGTVEEMNRKLDRYCDSNDKRVNGVEKKLNKIENYTEQQKGKSAAWGFIGGAVSIIITVATFWKKFF